MLARTRINFQRCENKTLLTVWLPAKTPSNRKKCSVFVSRSSSLQFQQNFRQQWTASDLNLECDQIVEMRNARHVSTHASAWRTKNQSNAKIYDRNSSGQLFGGESETIVWKLMPLKWFYLHTIGGWRAEVEDECSGVKNMSLRRTSWNNPRISFAFIFISDLNHYTALHNRT